MPDRLDRILHLVRRHVPALRLVEKSQVPWMRALGRVLRPIAPSFNTHFTTVLGATVYLPRPIKDFERDALAATLAHELVHQLDMIEHGAFFYISYGVALPAGRTLRAHWERRGYAVDLMLAWERGGEARLQRRLRQIIPLFAGPYYAWMWAGERATADFLAPTVEAVRAGELQQRAPYDAILAAWKGAPTPAPKPPSPREQSGPAAPRVS